MGPTGNTRLRYVRFAPYRKGCGPTFQLTTWDCGRPYREGPQWQIGYRLTMIDNGRKHTLFEAEDYGCAPGDAIDSDACIRGLMNFLTLRPGDTDADYFDGYTRDQLDYCVSHAESLSLEILNRYEED